VLVGLEYRVLVLDEHEPAAIARLLAGDAGQGVVEGVLAVEPPEEGHGRLVEHVAVEDILHEAVDQAHGQESHDALPQGCEELGVPRAVEREPEDCEDDGQGAGDRCDEERERKGAVLGLLGRGCGYHGK